MVNSAHNWRPPAAPRTRSLRIRILTSRHGNLGCFSTAFFAIVAAVIRP